jgi:hypothetical protein
MSNGPDDSGFDRYLEGSSELSRAYRDLGSDEPPASIDEAVLGAARHAPGRVRHRLVPLGAAALLLVSFGLVLRVTTAPQVQPAQPDDVRQGATDPAAPPRLPTDARGEKARALEATTSAKTAADTIAEAAACTRSNDGSQATPERRLEIIICLRAAGAEDAARRDLASFRAAFPDYPLPEPLRDP